MNGIKVGKKFKAIKTGMEFTITEDGLTDDYGCRAVLVTTDDNDRQVFPVLLIDNYINKGHLEPLN